MDALFDEHVRLPGCPDLIVTRGWAYLWLRDACGHDPLARGFASLDYLVFGRRAVDVPLSDLTTPETQALLGAMETWLAGAPAPTRRPPC